MAFFVMQKNPTVYVNSSSKIPYFGSKTPPKSLPVTRNSSYVNLESNAEKAARETKDRVDNQNANQVLDSLDKQFSPTSKVKKPKYKSAFENRRK